MTSLKHISLVAILAMVALCAAADVSAQDDDDIITVDSSIVLVNAAIINDSGEAVGGLEQKQFHIFEDGVEQEISIFAAESTPFAAVILIDSSGSMEQRLSMARSAAIRFLDGLRPGDVAAIYNFDSKAEMVQDFSNSRDIVEQVFDLKPDGMTALNDAIVKAASLLSERKEQRRAIIVISDGADTQSKRSADAALKAAIAANATIYTVDMSSTDMDRRERMASQAALKKYAEKSGGTFVATPGGSAMREAFTRIVEELGSQYTLAYQPTNIKKDGKFRAIEIRVSRTNLTIRTRKGYNAPKSK